MALSYRSESPPLLRDFLNYLGTVQGKSEKTVAEYYLDLRIFLRYLKQIRKLVPDHMEFDQIPIADVDRSLIASVTLSDVYDFLHYLAQRRPKYHSSRETPYGNSATTRARKVSALRAFYKYLTDKAHVLDTNPVANLDLPRAKHALPRYLTLEDSFQLLNSVDGKYRQRDYCILTLFLNCGLRVSELVGINLSDIQRDHRIRILGKSNKERMLYLNSACIAAIEEYMPHRITPLPAHANALFISERRTRISTQTVKWLVKRHLTAAGLEASKYSAHKLRHTAATLMYQNGVDVRALRDVLGHENLDTTMIYTHLTSADLQKAAELNPLAGLTPQRTSSASEPEENADADKKKQGD